MESVKKIRAGTILTHILFIVIVVYAVSAISVLNTFVIPQLSVFEPRIVLVCAMAAFGIMELISIYHLSTMLRRKKRKSDRETPGSREVGLNEILSRCNIMSRIIFAVIILYAIAAFVFIILVFGNISRFPEMHFNLWMLTIFTMVSCGLTGCISAYHWTTMIRRRKRKTDRA